MSSPNGNNHHVFMIRTTSPRVPVHNVNLGNNARFITMQQHISPHASPVRSVFVQSSVMGVPVSPQNRYSPYQQLGRRSLHCNMESRSVVMHPTLSARPPAPTVRPVHFKVTAAGKMITPRHETRSFQPRHTNAAVRPGRKVVCRNCGVQSTDTEACHSCGKKIWKNGTSEKKDKPTISQVVEAGLRATKAEIDRQSQKGIPSTSFYNGQESDFARYLRNSSTKSTTAKPARKRLNLVRNSTAARENVCITISSDSEDEEAKTATVLSADSSTSNLSKIEEKNKSLIKIPKPNTNTSVVVLSKETKPTPIVKTTKSSPVSESQPCGKSDDDLSQATLNLKIDFVRIGQLKLKAISVLRVSHEALTMTAHCTHTDLDRIISIKWENVSSCEICSDIHEPCLYITLNQGALPQLRQQLQMEKGKFPYYDPSGEAADEKFFIFYVNKSFILTATVASMEGLIRKIDLIRKKLKRPSTFLRAISFAESEERQTLAAANMKEDLLKEDDNQNTSVQTPSISSSQESTNAANSLQSAAVTPDKMTTRNRSKETPELDCDFKIFTGPRIELFIYPPPPMKGGISVTNEDQFCLNEGEFLNDVIIEFYMKYVYNNILSDKDRERSHIFSCFFYERLMQKSKKLKDVSPVERRHNQVKKWTRNVDIFSKDFIFVPINEASHWYLAVICFPGMDGAAWEIAMPDGTTKKVVEKYGCQEVISTVPKSMRYLSEYGTNEAKRSDVKGQEKTEKTKELKSAKQTSEQVPCCKSGQHTREISEYGTNKGERSEVKGQENTEKTKESKTAKQTSEQVIEKVQSSCNSEQQPREIPPTKSSGAAEKRKLILVNLPNFTLRKKKSKLSAENRTNVANDLKILFDDEKDSMDSSQNSQISDVPAQESESSDQAKLQETDITESKLNSHSSKTPENDEAVISNPESSKPTRDTLSSPKSTVPLTAENSQSDNRTETPAVKNEELRIENIPVEHSGSTETKYTTESSSPNQSTPDSESSGISALKHNSNITQIKQLSIPLQKVTVPTTKSPKKEPLPTEDKVAIPAAPNTQENNEVVISNPESSKPLPMEDKVAIPETIESPKKDPLPVDSKDSKVVKLLPWLDDALEIDAVSDPPTPLESTMLDSSSDTENMDCDDAVQGSKCDAMQNSKVDAATGSKDDDVHSSKSDAMQGSKHDAMLTSRDGAMQSSKYNAVEGSELENLQRSTNDDMQCSKLDKQSSKCNADLMQSSKHNAAHDATMDSEQDSLQGSKCDSKPDSEQHTTDELIDESMQGSKHENNQFELFVTPGSSGFALPKELKQKCTISPRRPEVRINRVPNKSPVRLKYLRSCGTSTTPIRISSSSLSSDDSVIILSSPEQHSIEATKNTDVQHRDMVPDQEKLSVSSLNLEFETSSHDLSNCDAIMQDQNNDSKVLSSPQHSIDDKQCRNTNCIAGIPPSVPVFSETSLPMQASQEKPGPSTTTLSLQDSEKNPCETTDTKLVECTTVEDSVDTKNSECQVPNSSSNTTNKTVSSDNKVANRQTCHNAGNVENQPFDMIKSAENEGPKSDNSKEMDNTGVETEGNSLKSAKTYETSDSGVSPSKRASGSELEETSSTVNGGNPRQNVAVAGVEASVSGEKLRDSGNVLGEEAASGADKDPKHSGEAAVEVVRVYKRPCILIFDSLRGPSRSKIATSLREYLTMEWKTRKQSTHGERVFDKDNLKMCSIIVPQQDNYTDCGLFLLHYVEKFFTKPIEKYYLPVKLENWFNPKECDKKRTDIKEVIDKLNTEWIATESQR